MSKWFLVQGKFKFWFLKLSRNFFFFWFVFGWICRCGNWEYKGHTAQNTIELMDDCDDFVKCPLHWTIFLRILFFWYISSWSGLVILLLEIKKQNGGDSYFVLWSNMWRIFNMFLRRISILLLGGIFYICLLGSIVYSVVQVLCLLIFCLIDLSIIKSRVLKSTIIFTISLFNSVNVGFISLDALLFCT